MSNYAIKPDLKKAAVVDTSQFTKNIFLASLKSEVDKLHIGKIEKLSVDKMVPVSTKLSKLSNVVKKDVVEKTEHHARIKDIEDKISSITNLITNVTLNAKISDVKGKIPNITNLAATATFTTVEDKISDVSDFGFCQKIKS